MNYQIRYDQNGKSDHISLYRKWATALTLVLLIIFVCWVGLWSLGGNHAVTIGALENMAVSLQNSGNISEAFSDFCLEILNGAECE